MTNSAIMNAILSNRANLSRLLYRHGMIIGLAAILIMISGCDTVNDDESAAAKGVFVASQGNFSDANGSAHVYDPELGSTSTYVDDALSTLQSATIADDRIYFVANSGARIDAYSLETSQIVGQITGLTSPRYMAVGENRLAYVTNLFKSNFTGGTVDVVDLASNTVTASIDVGNNPEGIAVSGGLVYVANNGFGSGQTLSVIDPSTNLVVETIDVGCDGPRMLFRDKEDEVWVVCTGKTEYDSEFNVIGQTNGQIVLVDGPTSSVIDRIQLSGQVSTAGPGQDAHYSEGEQELHVVLEGQQVLRFNTGANVLAEDLGTFAGDPIGAVAYDSESDRLYLGRVPGFVTSGYVTVHDRAGDQLESFPAGIAPTYIVFDREEQ